MDCCSRANLPGQRRKDRLHALESQVKSPGHTAGLSHESSASSRSSFDVLGVDQGSNGQERSSPNVQVVEGPNEEFLQELRTDPFLQLAPQPEMDLSICTDMFWTPFAAWPDASTPLPPNEPSLEESQGDPNIDPGLDISVALQTSESSNFSFPDDRTLEVPSLTLLNAATKVAYRLNLAHLIWDLTATSPFYRPDSTLPSHEASSTSTPIPEGSIDTTTIPSHLQPTPTQRFIPHHPVIDLLPWPATRDKLIQVFNLPEHLRPKSAQDPMALVRLVYDMEDVGGEGIKVRCGDPFNAQGWEIGQVVFERWWWAFDAGVVDQSNWLRRERGEGSLVLR